MHISNQNEYITHLRALSSTFKSLFSVVCALTVEQRRAGGSKDHARANLDKIGTQESHIVKKQPSQDVLYGDEAEEELGLACLVSSYTLPHQNSQPGERGRQTACSKVLSRRARDT